MTYLREGIGHAKTNKAAARVAAVLAEKAGKTHSHTYKLLVVFQRSETVRFRWLEGGHDARPAR